MAWDIDDARNSYDNEMINHIHGDDNESDEERYEAEIKQGEWLNDAEWSVANWEMI